MDSFLSAWVRKMRQTHGKYLKHVQVTDRPAIALHEIAQHVMWAKDSISADYIKQLWLFGTLERTNELHRLMTPPVDCRGFNMFSVFQHLEYQSTFEIESRCQCGLFYHRDFMLDVWAPEQIAVFGDPNRYHEVPLPICDKCQYPRTLLNLIPDERNWILPFNYKFLISQNPSPLLEDIPRIILMGDIVFKLEYLTYTQDAGPRATMSHEVSLQFIRHSWYVYDGCFSPKFRRWHQPDYKLRNARLESVVYFKVL